MANSKIIEFPSPHSRPERAYRKPLAAKGGDALPATKRQHPVKARLKELGWTMDELAVRVGVSAATIRNQLAGRHRMADGKFHRMLSVLGMNENQYWNCGPEFDRAKAHSAKHG